MDNIVLLPRKNTLDISTLDPQPLYIELFELDNNFRGNICNYCPVVAACNIGITDEVNQRHIDYLDSPDGIKEYEDSLEDGIEYTYGIIDNEMEVDNYCIYLDEYNYVTFGDDYRKEMDKTYINEFGVDYWTYLHKEVK